MRVLDLFSGIGGFALGLESVGMQTVAFCESDGYARRVLRRHWPDVWLYEDVRTLSAKRLKADGITGIDLICGGFPCQDISCAGKGAGIEGGRSGLWSEYARLIREVRPRWVFAENVPALRGRGADKVLGDLEAAGYSAWPLVVGAIHAGAPHRRQRAWIVANTKCDGARSFTERTSPTIEAEGKARHPSSAPSVNGRSLANSDKLRCDTRRSRQSLSRPGAPGTMAHANRHTSDRLAVSRSKRSPWHSEPDVGRVAHGVPARMDRLRCLGNAVVPQVVAMIGQAILRVANEPARQ